MIQPQNFPKKSRLGCVARFWLIIGAACLFLLAFQAVFMPWGFYLGGHFHIIPAWSGIATAHAANGRDYLLFVYLFPDVSHPGRYTTDLQGSGFICTPKGEKIRMTAGAYMDKHLGKVTQGKPIEIRMHSASAYSRMISADTRPSIQFKGVWGPDEISGDDHNSLGRAFEPDGSVYTGRSPTRGPSFPTVQITFHAASSEDFNKACSSQM